MSAIKKFTIKDATITLDGTTKLQFNSNKCDNIKSPYVLCIAFECEGHVLLLELQGFSTDKIVEPTKEEIEGDSLDYGNPYFVDCWHELFDEIKVMKNNDNFSLIGLQKGHEPIIYKKDELKRFHIYKVDNQSWTEIDLALNTLSHKSLISWKCFASGCISDI